VLTAEVPATAVASYESATSGIRTGHLGDLDGAPRRTKPGTSGIFGMLAGPNSDGEVREQPPSG